MDSNWNTAQGGAATGPSSGVGPDSNANLDWRLQLQPDARQRIVNKIMDTLKRHLPVPVPEGLNELQKIAVRFEEKIYSAATSQPDYLRKISLKMLSMETKAQPGLGPNIPNQNRVDPGGGMMSQQQPGSNPGQSLAMPTVINQAPVSRQQQQQPPLQGSPNMPTALSGGPSGAAIPPMSGPSISNSNPMTGPGGTSGPGGPTGSLSTDMYSNAQRRQQPQQLTSQNQILYQQQQQQLAIRHKLQQQQQQTQMQMSSALAGVSGMMSAAPTSGMQQSQLNSVQQPPAGQGGSFQQQALLRQQQQQPQATMQNPTIPMQQTNNVTDLQQQRLQMQQNQMQQSQMQQSQMQQSQMQQSQMQQSQMQQNQMQQNQMQQSQMQQSQMQQSQMQQNQLQQNQIQQNQMLNQQMLLGSGDASNINMQRQMQMQRKAALLQQQQPQQQQHLLSQLQPQQQQLPQQQQASMMQQREMQMSQQRMLGSSALLETQNNNAIDSQRQQQQQFIPQQQQPQQQQRIHQDVASSPASMDSTAQTVHPGDWQEELYQKLKYLKDTYFADLREIYQKLSIKLNQLDSMVLPNGKGGEQIEKMKHFKIVLEHMMKVLSLDKHNLQIALKDQVPRYEKQILSILQTHKKVPQQQPPAGVPSDQAQFPSLQQSQPGMQSHQPPQQQQQPPPPQMDNHTNQLQQQLSTNGLTQSNSLSMPNAVQQGMQNTLQSDQLLANSTGFGSLQQSSVGYTMQNTMNPPQMVGSGAAVGTSNMSHTVTMPGMQTNLSSAQVLKQQPQHQEQQIQSQQRMMPTPQQMQQRQFQQRLIQKQQLLHQQQLPLQQQRQQYPQQNQIQLLGQPSDSADLKSRQGAAGMKPGSVYQQQYPGLGPRNSYYHSQLKPGSNLPISSPQNIQSSSPQISQPSPKVDQGLIPPPQLKSGTPLQAAVSPFVPSPSPPVAPSPIIEDTKLGGLMHNSAALPTGQPLPATSAQTSQMGQPQAGSLVGTPGLSASPLLAEFTCPEAGQGTILSTQILETEKPIEKLARLMRTMPHNQRSAAVKDIASVVSMVDRIAGSAPGNGSRAAIGDDLVAMTKCRLQAKNLVHPDGAVGTSAGASPPTKKMKRDTSAMPLNINNNDGLAPDAVSVTDNFKVTGPDGSEMQSTATSSTKGLKSEMHCALLEELREINIRLIDTELTLNEEDADSTAEAGESILVKCTYKAITLSPSLRAHFTSSHLSPISPLRLLVPAGYPKCSPVIMDKLLDEQRDIDDFSTRARSKFNISIRGLSQPMSLKEIAHTWENCVRKVINEYAAQFGGGSFSSRMIKWQTVNPEDPYVIV